jgi:competence protein ComEC
MKVLQFPLARITIGFVLGILISFIKPEIPFHFYLAALLLLVQHFLKTTLKTTICFGLSTFPVLLIGAQP